MHSTMQHAKCDEDPGRIQIGRIHLIRDE
jgi:hypothetical protein